MEKLSKKEQTLIKEMKDFFKSKGFKEEDGALTRDDFKIKFANYDELIGQGIFIYQGESLMVTDYIHEAKDLQQLF